MQIYMILIDNADYCEFLNKAFTIKIDVAKKLSIIKVPDKITTYENHNTPYHTIYKPPNVNNSETKGSIIKKTFIFLLMPVIANKLAIIKNKTDKSQYKLV